MSLYAYDRDCSENGRGKFTIVAYRRSSEVSFRGYVEARYDSNLQCIECDTAKEVEEALITLEKENLNLEHGQKEWAVRIYQGTDLTQSYEAPEDSDEELLVVDFAAIEAKAKEEHEAARAALMAVRMMQAHELAEKVAAEKEAKERSELRRLQEKYKNA
jgi:hypothetical protein